MLWDDDGTGGEDDADDVADEVTAILEAHASVDSELARHACLAYLRQGASQAWTFERGTGRKAERVVVNVEGPFRANNSEVLRDAVLAGAGVGLLPDFSAAGHVGPRQLVPLLPEWRPLGFFGDAIYAIRPWSPQVPRAVQCFVDYLRQALKAGFALS